MDLLDQFSKDELLYLVNIDNLPLDQMPWTYSRGARVDKNFNAQGISDGTELRIKYHYDYTYKDGMREIATVVRHRSFYDTDGVTILFSDSRTIQYTPKSLGELNQSVRNGRITDLMENARDVSGGQALVDALYGWYGNEIDQYIMHNNLTIETTIKNEVDPARRAVLDTSIPEFGGATVDALLSFQIVGGYTW